MTHREIRLTNGQIALVDEEDFDLISSFSWWPRPKGNTTYATRGLWKNNKQVGLIRMHRLIMNPPEGMVVDHINGNGLDNRKSNLRICTPSTNQRNRRGHRNGRLLGTFEIKDSKKNSWGAQIGIGGKKPQIYLGSYPTQEFAHEAVLLALALQLV